MGTWRPGQTPPATAAFWMACLEFYTFKWLGKRSKERVFCDMWTFYEMELQLTIKLYWDTAVFVGSHAVCSCFCASEAVPAAKLKFCTVRAPG